MYKEEFKLSVPVLLIAFNRPDTTKMVLNKIKEAKPSELYVAVDGPRGTKVGEEELVKQVKEIVQNIDWPCVTHYKFNEINRGAEVTVSSAISWVLEKEEYVIILEDDIITSISFFRFIEEMLIKYRYDDRICMVSGCNYSQMNKSNAQEDYIFTKYGHISGWGTWKRAWKKFDLNINNFKDVAKYKTLRKTCESKAETLYFLKKYKAFMKKGSGNNTWDACWGYIYRTNNLLAIIPRVNLTSNIGVYGLHSIGKTEHHYRPYDETFIVKRHPHAVKKNIEYDKFHFVNYIKKHQNSLIKKILKKIKRFTKKTLDFSIFQ
jgi:hypothetical protein